MHHAVVVIGMAVAMEAVLVVEVASAGAVVDLAASEAASEAVARQVVGDENI